MSDRIEAIRLEAARLGRRATLDPGAFVKRGRDEEGDYERLDQWQERALLAALAPVAPDAEPTEWEWSPGDVVRDPEDGTVMARITDGTYPWRSTNGVDQRDQDITDLVTKHGGRVLVCKTRGIGVGGAS